MSEQLSSLHAACNLDKRVQCPLQKLVSWSMIRRHKLWRSWFNLWSYTCSYSWMWMTQFYKFPLSGSVYVWESYKVGINYYEPHHVHIMITHEQWKLELHFEILPQPLHLHLKQVSFVSIQSSTCNIITDLCYTLKQSHKLYK